MFDRITNLVDKTNEVLDKVENAQYTMDRVETVKASLKQTRRKKLFWFVLILLIILVLWFVL